MTSQQYADTARDTASEASDLAAEAITAELAGDLGTARRTWAKARLLARTADLCVRESLGVCS